MSENKESLRLLAETQDAFTQWRLKKKHGDCIPELLWERALALLSHFSVSRAASALKLNATELKSRAVAAGVLLDSPKRPRKKRSSGRVRNKSRPAFLEVGLTDEVRGTQGLVRSVPQPEGWRLTWTRNDGVRLEVQPPALDLAQVTALIQSFLAT